MKERIDDETGEVMVWDSEIQCWIPKKYSRPSLDIDIPPWVQMLLFVLLCLFLGAVSSDRDDPLWVRLAGPAILIGWSGIHVVRGLLRNRR